MDEEHYILTYFKFGQESDIFDMLRNGTIYMNPIQKFREIKDEQVRGDNYEGVTKVRNLPAGQLEIESLGVKGNYIKIHLRESYEKVLGNIYCLYCISSNGFPDPKNIRIDQKVKKFGTHLLMITDCLKFRDRLFNGLNATGLKYHHDFVQYYDKDAINDSINLFQKPLEFEYQKEYRIYVERDAIDPFSFQIGSLEEIAVVFPIDKIDEHPVIK